MTLPLATAPRTPVRLPRPRPPTRPIRESPWWFSAIVSAPDTASRLAKAFPDYLQKKLDAEGLQWHVVNLGISGDTTEGGVSRIDSATTLKPAIVVLELGGNDGLRGLPLASTRQNLDQMITAFQQAGARVVLAGMTLPPNYGPDYVHEFEKIYKDLAAQHKLTLIPFLMADIVTKDLRYIQRDGIHPTAPGSEIIAGTVLRAVKPLLQ